MNPVKNAGRPEKILPEDIVSRLKEAGIRGMPELSSGLPEKTWLEYAVEKLTAGGVISSVRDLRMRIAHEDTEKPNPILCYEFTSPRYSLGMDIMLKRAGDGYGYKCEYVYLIENKTDNSTGLDIQPDGSAKVTVSQAKGLGSFSKIPKENARPMVDEFIETVIADYRAKAS